MESITIRAPAKINLFLDVIGKRPDGYHNLNMVMQTVSLYDDIEVVKIDKGIKVECEARYVPHGEKNIAYKAANLMMEQFKLGHGVSIKISKKIPVAAGLAGGSTDAAAVMKGINQLFDLGLDNHILAGLGKHVGADVPFCVFGGTALAQGIGEEITQLKSFSGVPIILVKPDFSVSTAYVFKKYTSDQCSEKPDASILIEYIEMKDMEKVGQNLFNALEKVTAKENQVIKDIKDSLRQHGAVGSLMSGSGPSVFGLFDDYNKAKHAFCVLQKNFKDTFILETL